MVQVPQQDNSCDCGVFVLEYIERFSREFTRDGCKTTMEWTDEETKGWFTKKDIKTKRTEIMRLLKNLNTTYNKTCNDIDLKEAVPEAPMEACSAAVRGKSTKTFATAGFLAADEASCA